jgi:hypothetical protein
MFVTCSVPAAGFAYTVSAIALGNSSPVLRARVSFRVVSTNVRTDSTAIARRSASVGGTRPARRERVGRAECRHAERAPAITE